MDGLSPVPYTEIYSRYGNLDRAQANATSAASGLTPAQEKQLRESAQDFESLFLSQMMASMRKSIDSEGLIPQSNGEAMFTQMLDGEYAKQSTVRGTGLGIADMVYAQLYQKAQHQRLDPLAKPKLHYGPKPLPLHLLRQAAPFQPLPSSPALHYGAPPRHLKPIQSEARFAPIVPITPALPMPVQSVDVNA